MRIDAKATGMRIRWLSILVVAMVLLQSCGQGTIVHQTRYIPRASELTWDQDYEQLPWRPPALRGEHIPRANTPDRGRWAYETNFDIDDGPTAFYYEGDATVADPVNGPSVEH